MYYYIPKEITIVKQPYGAAIFSDHNVDFSLTNMVGAEILTACDGTKTVNDLLDEITVLHQAQENNLAKNITEFINASEEMGHLCRSNERKLLPPNCQGSYDKLSLLRAAISITNDCNQRCKYCYTEAGSILKKRLSKKGWFQIFERLQEWGVKQVIFTGGEPFIRKDIIDLLIKCNDLGFSISLLTNGTLIDKKICSLLKQVDKLHQIKISIDSLRPGVYNHLRGKKTWKKAIGAINNLKDTGKIIVINMTVVPDNVHEIEYIAEFCKKYNLFLELSPIIREGRALELSDEYFLNYEENKSFEEELRRISMKFTETLITNEKEILPKWETDFKCAMTYGTIGLTSEGLVKPCLRSDAFFKKLSPRLISQDSLSKIPCNSLNDIGTYKTVLNISSKFVPSIETCYGCEYLDRICIGCVVGRQFCIDRGLCRKEVKNEK